MSGSLDLTPSLLSDDSSGVWMLSDPEAAAAGIKVVFCGRRGGNGSGPFESLNLSHGVGDDPGTVTTNRGRVIDRCALHDPPAFLRQVHGRTVVEVDSVPPENTPGDALVARSPGVTLGILTADCAPIALAGPDGVAMVHAGWRGLVAGVVHSAAQVLGEVSVVWVGPCIRSCCYEVGPEVIDGFEEAGLPVADDTHVDVMDAAAQAARSAGATKVVTADLCTSCEADLFFSHRRDGNTGRQGGFITRADGAL